MSRQVDWARDLARTGTLLIAFGLAAVAALATVHSSPLLPDNDSALSQKPPVAQQAASPEAPKASTVPQDETAQLQAILKKVQTPSLSAVAQTLGLSAPEPAAGASDSPVEGLVNIGDLDGDGVPEAAVKWQAPVAGQVGPTTAVSPAIFLLSWDGSEWLASKLVTSDQAVTIKHLPSESGRPPELAAIVHQGAVQIAFPVIFRFQAHRAELAWDGRSDQTYYQGLPFSEVGFRAAAGAEFPQMAVSGLADPGLLIFPRDPASQRGFRVLTIYEWKRAGYFPASTRYEQNPDYTLYRFIAALHRHDFKEAYSLVEPRGFIAKGKLTVDRFRQQIEKEWPEFVDDQIFDAVSASGRPLPGHTFELRDEDQVKAIFRPRFGPGPKFLLLGLERVKPE